MNSFAKDDIFSGRARVLVVGLGLVSLAFTLASIFYGGSLTDPKPTGRDSYSRKSAIGHHAFVRLLSGLGFRVSRGRYSHALSHGELSIFAEPTRSDVKSGGDSKKSGRDSKGGGTKTLDLASVLGERSAKGRQSIVVLPKWAPDRSRPGSKAVLPDKTTKTEKILRSLFPDSQVAEVIHIGEPSKSSKSQGSRVDSLKTNSVRYDTHRVQGSLGRYRVSMPQLQLLQKGIGVETLLGTDEGILIGSVLKDDMRFVIVSDPDLLHNFNIHRADHARIWQRLLSSYLDISKVRIDEVFHGHGTQPSLGAALGRFPAVLLVIQIFFLCVAFVSRGFVRRGPIWKPKAVLGRGPRQAVEVPAGVLSLSKDQRFLSRRYTEGLLGELQQRVFGSGVGDTSASVDAVATERLQDLAEREGLGAGPIFEQLRKLQSGAPERGLVRSALRSWTFRLGVLQHLGQEKSEHDKSRLVNSAKGSQSEGMGTGTRSRRKKERVA